MHFSFPHPRCMICSSRPPSIAHYNYILLRAQVMKLVVCSFLQPLIRLFLSAPRRSVSKQPESMFFPWTQRPRFTPIKEYTMIINIVTHMTIARQRLGKYIPGVTLSTVEGYPSLGNGIINTHSRTREEKCFPWGPCQWYIRESNSKAGNCRSTEQYKEYKQYNGEQRRTRAIMERVLMICEMGREQ
jgi:hypothetical protein